MGNYKKGIEMRQTIIQEARTIFNKEGLSLTLDQLAGKLNLTKGRITNYFPTKDKLFVALSQDYDLRFRELLASFADDPTITFHCLTKVFAAIMDLQYEYRSAIIFVATTSSSQKDMHDQITHSYKANSKGVKQIVQTMIDAGLLKPEILEPENFEVFSFQHINLFTTWIISLEIYDSSSSYKKMKPVYLKGIMGTYYPYLTRKGQNQFKEVMM
jgi:AcrR family transcriptional regulator